MIDNNLKIHFGQNYEHSWHGYFGASHRQPPTVTDRRAEVDSPTGREKAQAVSLLFDTDRQREKTGHSPTDEAKQPPTATLPV